MTRTFQELVGQVGTAAKDALAIDRDACSSAARTFVSQRRAEIRERHRNGDSGGDVVRKLSDGVDELLGGLFRIALQRASDPDTISGRLSLCALGGYARRELSPYSDIDVCLLYEGKLDREIRRVARALWAPLWDAGFPVGHAVRSVEDSIALAQQDSIAFTGLLEARLVAGGNDSFARLRIQIRELQSGDLGAAFIEQRVRGRYDNLPANHADLYNPQPDVKENAGGLRDFHTALWLLMMAYSVNSLDEAVAHGLITPDEELDFLSGLDYIWRVRNQLHFHAGKHDDALTFTNQHHVAQALGYGTGQQDDVAKLMQDYYVAAGKMRQFLRIAARICHYSPAAPDLSPDTPPGDGDPYPDWAIEDGFLYAGGNDPDWFVHRPSRLIEVYWNCARNDITLSRTTERLVTENLGLVNDTFRSDDLVRRYFQSICNRPLRAGRALRQAARVGLLGRYIPEFAAVAGLIRYQSFHTYPVDEHTIRAIEALAAIPEIEGPVGRGLWEALEHLSDPYILVVAILCHDLGKAAGDIHVDESARKTRQVCRRIGFAQEDTDQIESLVQHHVLMNFNAQYRDIDDPDIIQTFCDAVKSEQRLRALFLLSYADLVAVGPSVWNDWKGTLLLQLYLRSMKWLVGRGETVDERYWESPKADEIVQAAPVDLRNGVRPHLQALGQQYFVAFTPKQVGQHLECLAEAKTGGLALRAATDPMAAMSEVVISTQDRQGLFSQIAGCFSSQLIDVTHATLFTRPDGWVVDVFKVRDAWQGQPLTRGQINAVERVLRAVLLEGRDVQEYVDQSRRKLFALLQPPLPVPTRVEFDNHSSRLSTVIDIETGDRTGLLYDITQAMVHAGLDISTSRIVTDARRARDSFYVTKDQAKIEDEQTQAAIREIIRNAIHPRTAAGAEATAGRA